MTRQNDEKTPSWLKDAKKLALNCWNKNHDFYRNAVFLVDPKAERQIDNIIITRIWPAALKAIGTTRFRVFGGEKPTIEQEWYVHACRSVNIIIEDPEHPFVPGDYPTWYARLNIQCHVSGPGMFRDYLSLHLPVNTPYQLIFDLLAETSCTGLPTKLSVYEEPEGNKSLHLVFENGGPGNSMSRALSLAERIECKLKAYCDFIEAACEIEKEPGEALLFRKLIREVNAVFEI